MNYPVSFTTMGCGHECPACGSAIDRGDTDAQCDACHVIVHEVCCRRLHYYVVICGSCEREYLEGWTL